MANVKITDNSKEFIQEMRRRLKDGATDAGEKAANDIAETVQKVTKHPTGNLAGSLESTVDSGAKKTVIHVGTNVNYAIYVEMGTGAYVPGGRDTPWAWRDAAGNWHRTIGQPPKPFLKPTITRRGKVYFKIIEDALKK